MIKDLHWWSHRQGKCVCGCKERVFVRGYGRVCFNNLKDQLVEQGYKLIKKRSGKQ